MEDTADHKQQPVITEQICPRCQATIPVHPHYVSWCDKCGWNLQPAETTQPRNVFETVQASLGRKYGESLFASLRQTELPRSEWTWSRLLAYLLAAIIHLLPLPVAALGLLCLAAGERSLAGLFVSPVPTWSGLALLGFAAFLLPRPNKFPTNLASRKEFPALYELADKVADALGARRVYGIVIDESFNASFVAAGWRRKAIVRLGLPLFSILDGQEKIVLLAHELAHSVNRDLSRGLFVGSAINSLLKWYDILTPDQLAPVEYGLVGYLLVPFNLLRIGLAHSVRLVMFGLAHLLWRDAQRAEYLADYLAASVGGTEAALSTLHKSHLGLTFHTTVKRVYLNWDNQNLFAEFQERLSQVPDRELERLKRVERLQDSRLDIVHPPTGYRFDFLQAHAMDEPQVTLSCAEQDCIEQELAQLQTKIQKRLLDMYAQSIGGRRVALVNR